MERHSVITFAFKGKLLFGFWFFVKKVNSVITILWKSVISISIATTFWKDYALFVINKSIHDGFLGFLKQVSEYVMDMLLFKVLEQKNNMLSYDDLIKKMHFIFVVGVLYLVSKQRIIRVLQPLTDI